MKPHFVLSHSLLIPCSEERVDFVGSVESYAGWGFSWNTPTNEIMTAIKKGCLTVMIKTELEKTEEERTRLREAIKSVSATP